MLQPHRRGQSPVELDHDDVLQQLARIGFFERFEPRNIAHRFEVLARQVCRLPGFHTLVVAAKAADRLLGLTRGPHLLLGCLEALGAHARHSARTAAPVACQDETVDRLDPAALRDLMPFAVVLDIELLDLDPACVRGRMQWTPERTTAGGLMR